VPQASTPSRSLRGLLVLLVIGVAVVVTVLPLVRAGAATSAANAAPDQPAPTSVPAPASAPTAPAGDELGPGKAILLGLVEGVTEFLPVSSTGHLAVLERLLNVGTSGDESKRAADAYAVVIQAGAILAVVVLYHQRLLSVLRGLIGRDEQGRKLLIALVVAFLPAAVVGFVFEKKIKEVLFAPGWIVVAWIAGGLVLLALSSRGWWDRERNGAALEALSVRNALIIGVVQCLALWPGTSRSLVTIVAALLVGLSLSAAVEFSFLLGLVTLGAATALDAVKDGKVIVDEFGVFNPLLGFVVAFVAAVIAIRWMVGYLQNHSLAIFGWYRLGIALVTIILLVTGVIAT
jgi:undecaprenyl-diphosphatase